MKLIDQFERIYIVNLPERADRRREMEVELGRYDIRVDGTKIRYLKAVRPESAGLFPSLGSRGCFLSHLAILNHAVEDDLANVLVMEDDLSVDERFAADQTEMCQTLQAGNWHFAYLGHVLGLSDHGGKPFWQAGSQPIATTHFYALNRPVIRPLRDYLEACLTRQPGDPVGGPMHVDGAYSLFRKHHPQWVTLIAKPSLGGQRSSRSDIFPNKWYDRTPLFAQIAGSMRTVKNLGKRAAKPK